MRAPIARSFLLDEAAAHRRRRKAETPTQRDTRQRAQDAIWTDRATKDAEHYPATRRGFQSHLGQFVPSYEILCAWCLYRCLSAPSTWPWQRRLTFLEHLAAGVAPDLYDPTTDTRRGDRSPAQFRADWLAACRARMAV